MSVDSSDEEEEEEEDDYVEVQAPSLRRVRTRGGLTNRLSRDGCNITDNNRDVNDSWVKGLFIPEIPPFTCKTKLLFNFQCNMLIVRLAQNKFFHINLYQLLT